MSRFFVVSLSVSAAVVGCSDPQCGERERKVADTCVAIKATEEDDTPVSSTHDAGDEAAKPKLEAGVRKTEQAGPRETDAIDASQVPMTPPDESPDVIASRDAAQVGPPAPDARVHDAAQRVPSIEMTSICTSDERKCDGNRVITCSADGLRMTMEACESATPYCVGRGECVACRAGSDCSTVAGECLTAVCTNGVCSTSPRDTGDKCSQGYCSDEHECVECTTDSHCAGSSTVCDTSVSRCVRCTRASDCDTGEACESNVCVKACGNGRVDSGEECDPKAPGLDTFRCSPACATRKLLARCSADSECGSGSCFDFGTGKLCYARSNTIDASDCPALERFVFTNIQGVCVVACNPNEASPTCPAQTPKCYVNPFAAIPSAGYCNP